MNRKLKGEEQISAEARVLEESMKGDMRSLHPLPTLTLKNQRTFFSNTFQNRIWEPNPHRTKV
jgi:hypothetical protein